MATKTLLKLRPDVSCTTSGHFFCCVGTYLLLRRNVSFDASERTFLPLSPVKMQKNDRKRLVFNRKNNVFAQCAHSFCKKKL